MEMRGIEPRSASRRVSLSFTCVVAMSLATEFEDSACDLSPCLSRRVPRNPKHPTSLSGLQSYPLPRQSCGGPDFKQLLERQQLRYRLQLCVSRLVRAGREPLTRERTFLPTSKPIIPIEMILYTKWGQLSRGYLRVEAPRGLPRVPR